MDRQRNSDILAILDGNLSEIEDFSDEDDDDIDEISNLNRQTRIDVSLDNNIVFDMNLEELHQIGEEVDEILISEYGNGINDRTCGGNNVDVENNAQNDVHNNSINNISNNNGSVNGTSIRDQSVNEAQSSAPWSQVISKLKDVTWKLCEFTTRQPPEWTADDTDQNFEIESPIHFFQIYT